MQKRVYILLILVLFIAIFLRTFKLADIPPGLYPDEAMNGNNAIETLEKRAPKVFYPENNGREGLYIMLESVMVAVFGNEPWTLRLLSAIFGILTVLGIFLLTRELFYKQYGAHANHIALLAAFFLAISFWHINFSRIAFRAIMAPFFATFGFYFLWLTFRESLSDTKRTLAAATGGIFFGLGFYSYIAYRVMPLLLIIPAIRIWAGQRLENIGKKGCLWCSFTLFLFFTFVAAAPLGIYFLEHPEDFLGRTAQISIFDSENPIRTLVVNTIQTIGMFWFTGDGNWRHNFAGSPQLWWPVGILFALGIFAHIKNIFRKENTSVSIFLLGWLGLGLLPVIFSNEGLPHALRAILVIPPIMIIAAYELTHIADNIGKWLRKKEITHPTFTSQLHRIKRELIILLFIFLFIGAAQSAFMTYFLDWGKRSTVYFAFSGTYTDIGSFINTLPQETEKFIIVNTGGVAVPVPEGARALPMPVQTIMFITDSWSYAKQKEKNIIYLLPEEIETITCVSHCIITSLEHDPSLYALIKKYMPDALPVRYNDIIILEYYDQP